jgi:hypothetical protein
MQLKKRTLASIGMVVIAAATLSACATTTETTAPKATTASAAVDLSKVCPATVILQTDWNPEADHGHAYQLLGPNPVINADKKIVSGDLYSGGKSTGVKIEIRSGGPAIGYSSVSAQMYQDKSITLGYVSSDEALSNSVKLPTTAVFAENDISPQMIMWDPTTYPDVTDIKSLGTALEKSGGVVRYFNGAAYMNYLIGSGTLSKSVTDGSYDGTPAKFVVGKGKDAQQGFATAEPYIYQNEVAAWGKKVDFQLVNDTGYPFYPEAVSVRTGDLTTLTPCLEKLVPVLQQADVDYFKSPDSTNALIVQLVTAYNNGWVYSKGVADYAVKTMKDLKIATNGDNAYVGDFDEARFQKIIDIDTPIFTASGSAPKAGLKATDLFTNQFIDKTIGF